ncbi:MAG: hypothetical protein KRP56_04435 [Candidatus Methanogranum gryphiswaldense]|nr:MAG: hypothetical protein KRP56_04435 [Candidatus Methanogranum sp. U3.2.1]
MGDFRLGATISIALITVLTVTAVSVISDDSDAISSIEYSDLNTSDFYDNIIYDIKNENPTEYNIDLSSFTSTNTIVPSPVIEALASSDGIKLIFNVYSNEEIYYIYMIDSLRVNEVSSASVVDIGVNFNFESNETSSNVEDSVILIMNGEGIQPFVTTLYLNLGAITDEDISNVEYTVSSSTDDLEFLTIDGDYMVFELSTAQDYVFNSSEQVGSDANDDSKINRIIISMIVSAAFIIGILAIFRNY